MLNPSGHTMRYSHFQSNILYQTVMQKVVPVIYPCGREKSLIRRLVWSLLCQNLKCLQQFFPTPEVSLSLIIISKTGNDLQLNSTEQDRMQSMILNTFVTRDTGILHYIQDFMDLGTFLNTIAPTLLHFPSQGQKR